MASRGLISVELVGGGNLVSYGIHEGPRRIVNFGASAYGDRSLRGYVVKLDGEVPRCNQVDPELGHQLPSAVCLHAESPPWNLAGQGPRNADPKFEKVTAFTTCSLAQGTLGVHKALLRCQVDVVGCPCRGEATE